MADPAVTGTSPTPADGPSPELQRLTLSDGFKTLDVRNDFDHAVRTPCVRRALLLGMTGAFAMGGLRWVFSRNIRSALNWSFGPGIVLAVGSNIKCNVDLNAQKRRIAQAIEFNRERARQRAEGGPPEPKLPKGVLGASSDPSPSPSPKSRLI